MLGTELVDLEARIRDLPGVVGCVILSHADGSLSEIQAFTRSGVDREEVKRAILEEVDRRDLRGSLSHVYVFELEAESQFGDRETLERAAELAEQEARARGPARATRPTARGRQAAPAATGGRPLLQRVALSTTAWSVDAEVALGEEHGEFVGQASGEKTTHGLAVLAQATLSAVVQIIDTDDLRLAAASLVEVAGREAVLVLVQQGDEAFETVGAALVRSAPVTEAAVRATLDAVNRRLLVAGARFTGAPSDEPGRGGGEQGVTGGQGPAA